MMVLLSPLMLARLLTLAIFSVLCSQKHRPHFCNGFCFLGRFLRVDVIKWVFLNVRPSTASFFDFNEIRYVGVEVDE